MNSGTIIQTTGLSYTYGKDGRTLFGLNLEVPKGSIYGFLGPNGSGKTTTLSLVLGLLKQQEGSIQVFGKSLRDNRTGILQKVGALIESPSLYGHLTARENLEVYRGVYAVPKERIGKVLKIVHLDQTGSKLVKRFSLGMKQRLAIALALLPKPELLILDEPSNGLDPAGIVELRTLVKKLNSMYGITIVISSHLLSEVEKMVTHVGIIAKGQLLCQGTMQELKDLQQQRTKVLINTSDNESAFRVLGDFQPERNCKSLLVPFHGKPEVAHINRLLTQNGLDVYLLQPTENNLEQLFIELTNNPS